METTRRLTRHRPIRARRAFALCIVAFAVQLDIASAGDVYRWVDENGQVHFSTTPQNPNDRPANLPDVKREKIDERIRKIQESTPKNCVKHGGVDCRQGADTDGSVVCLDGYRDAIQPHRFACLEARVRVDTLHLLDVNGEPVSADRKKNPLPPQSVQISVRNLTGVAANGLVVAVTPSWSKSPVTATGPEIIEPFTVAEYTAPLADTPVSVRTGREPFGRTSYKVSCTNCTEVASGKR